MPQPLVPSRPVMISPPAPDDWVHIVDSSAVDVDNPNGTSKRAQISVLSSGITPTLINTHIGFGGSTNKLTGSSDFTWDDSLKSIDISGSISMLGTTINPRRIEFTNANGILDEKKWYIGQDSFNLEIVAGSDDGFSDQVAMGFIRGSGVTLDSAFVTSKFSCRDEILVENTGDSKVVIRNDSQALNEKQWSIRSGGKNLSIGPDDDTGALSLIGLEFNRGTGISVDNIFCNTNFYTQGSIGVFKIPPASCSFDVGLTTKASRPAPPMDTEQRDDIPFPEDGYQIYNTDLKRLQTYNAATSVWVDVGHDVELTNQQIAFGSVNNTVTSSSDFYIDPSKPYLTLSGLGSSRLIHEFRNGSSEQKRWAWETGNGQLRLNVQSDDGVLNAPVFTVSRTGLTVTEFLFTKNIRANSGISTEASKEPSAIAEFQSTTQGLLPPKMTQAQRDLIASPAVFLLISNLTTGKYNYWTGSSWAVLDTSTPSPTVQKRLLSVGDLVRVPGKEPAIQMVSSIQPTLALSSSYDEEFSYTWAVPSETDFSTIEVGFIYSDNSISGGETSLIQLDYQSLLDGDLVDKTPATLTKQISTSATINEFQEDIFATPLVVSFAPNKTSYVNVVFSRKAPLSGTPFSGEIRISGIYFKYNRSE